MRAPTRTWLIFGPLLILAGACLGRFYPQWVGREGSNGSSAVAAGPDSGRERLFGLPSLAPLLDEVRSGVVIITTDRGSGEGSAQVDNPPGTHVPTALAEFGVVRGTGFLVHENGLVVTSHHVVADYDEIRVDLEDERSFPATVVAEDPISDLALLRIDGAPGDLQALPLGDSERVRQGDFVISLGSPYEFHRSSSFGLITYVGRHLTEEGVHVTNEYLQFSAPVNPGQSGAPLFDMRGRVIGVTRRTFPDGRGISFAVPSKVVATLLQSAEEGEGHVRRGYIGMEFTAPSRPQRLRDFVSPGGGAEVTGVIRGHPADAAGVRVGDVILSYGGEPVEHAAALYEQITKSAPGTLKRMSVYRDGAILPTVTVRVSEVGKTSVD